MPKRRGVIKPKEKERTPPEWYPEYRTYHQKVALELCRSEYSTCPFGCAKDGAPNCDAHVRNIGLAEGAQCEPGRLTRSRADYEQEVQRGAE